MILLWIWSDSAVGWFMTKNRWVEKQAVKFIWYGRGHMQQISSVLYSVLTVLVLQFIISFMYFVHHPIPSKHARLDLHPVLIEIGSEALTTVGPMIQDCTPACFQIVSWNKNWIWAGCSQYDPGYLWKNATKPESGKLVAGWLHFAKSEPSDWLIHTQAFFRTRCDWSKPGWASFAQYDQCLLWKNGTKSDVGSHIYAGSDFQYPIYIYIYPAWFWLYAGCNGHNWL